MGAGAACGAVSTSPRRLLAAREALRQAVDQLEEETRKAAKSFMELFVLIAGVVVELDAAPGALMAGNLLDAPYTEAKVGRRVELTFQKLNDDFTLPQFRLAQ